jgi:hypothetical protein
VSSGELRHEGFGCTHPCTRRMIITPRSLRLRRDHSARLYIFTSSFIDIVIYASTSAIRTDEDACSPYRRIWAKSSERWNSWRKSEGHGTVLQVEDEQPSTSRCLLGEIRSKEGGREEWRDHTASEVRESGDSMMTYCGHSGVSIAPFGFTKATNTTTTSASINEYAHIHRPWFHVQLVRFVVVSSLSRHNSSTIPSGRLYYHLSNHHPVLDFHTSEHRHLGHEHFNYGTFTPPTTLHVEDVLARTPCSRRAG